VKKQWDRSYERSLFFYFMKRPDGVFEKLEGRPNADKSSARYIVRASVHPQPLSDPPRLDRSSWEDIGYNGRRWEVSVPTPQAFAATGPSSTIVCFTPKNLYEKFGRRCVAYVRSNSLYWYINIDFPPPRRPAAHSEEAGDGSAVVDPELVKFHQAMESNSIEAYNLLATHILTQ
jgi:hypothetical protein